ncbi:MAG: flagellar biosynthetic protein FliO [Ignavibacteriales bacterium]|nr:flagellar biosynthetic protein FliO [Ignavibacteriales bacterium]
MSFIDIIKSIVPLLLILALLFGILILVRRHSFSLNGKKAKNINVNVLFNQMILPKKYLSFVKIKDKLLVLGISENNISLLKEFDYNDFEGDELGTNLSKPNFVEILKQNLGIR